MMVDVEYHAIDRSSNKTAPKRLRVFKDTEPPVITYTIENGYVAEDGSIIIAPTGKIIFNITDNYGLGKFYYKIDTGEWKEVQLSGKSAQVTLTL